MKLQRNTFKWIAMAIALAMFLGFAVALPSASAQEENPLTPTPGEQPLQTPEPLQMPEI